MRDFSKVSPTVWRSRKFKLLEDDVERLAYFYVLTNPHANSAGCYDLPPAYACVDLKWKEDDFVATLERLSDVGLIAFDKAENTLLVTNWVTFNVPTNPKHALGILDQLDDASSSQLKAVRFHELKAAIIDKQWHRHATMGQAVSKALDSFSERLRKPIATKTETETETETERETETESKTETIRTVNARARPAGLAAAPDGAARPSVPEQGNETDTELPAKLPDHLNTPFMRRQR